MTNLSPYEIASHGDGRIHFVDPNQVLVSNGYEIHRSTDSGATWENVAVLPGRSTFPGQVFSRLLRRGVHHLIPTSFGFAGVVDRNVFTLSNDLQSALLQPLNGSRPLSFTVSSDGCLLYGEYRGNKERTPVSVWRGSPDGTEWEPAIELSDVRHIHGVHPDPYTGDIWITTGDTDEESQILRTDVQFSEVEVVSAGAQRSRAVDLVFSPDYVFFGTDTPLETNFIMAINRDSAQVEELGQVDSSVFYGTAVGDKVFFGTVVEPSDVNETREANIVEVDSEHHVSKIISSRKDILPMKYFQYGQFHLAKGPGDGRNLWFSGFATSSHNQLFSLLISDA